MASTTFLNIAGLVNTREQCTLLRGAELGKMPVLKDAYLVIEGDEIADFGSMSHYRHALSGDHIIDARSRFILPAFCDSHTHLVFPASREGEFIDKIKGISYAEIAARGGGILNSAKGVEELSEDQLFNQAWSRLEEISLQGTGAVEIKSGYGLSVEGELKMLRVIKKLKERSSLAIKATFLGAHAYPAIYRDDHRGYIDLLIREMLPVIAAESLADYIDVFCEKGFFSLEETAEICRAGQQYGLKPKLHANQLNAFGAVELGVKLNALSVDHLESMNEEAITALSSSETIGTLLPTAAFFLNLPYPPARELIQRGAALALASDYNPGSSPGGNMSFVISLACIKMRMLPEEAINAATLNGAYAMELADSLGSISKGKKASIILTQPIPSLNYLPYRFSTSVIERTMIKGKWIS